MLEDLILYQKMYDLIKYSFPVLNNFPKSQKFVLAQQIENTFLKMLDLIVTANKLKSKARTLFLLDVELQKAKTLVRLAVDLRFMSIKRYGIFSEKLAEIGRLIGGWSRKKAESG